MNMVVLISNEKKNIYLLDHGHLFFLTMSILQLTSQELSIGLI